MKKSIMKKYAQAVVKVGANVQKGQYVHIYANIRQADFVTALATSYLIQNDVEYIRVHNVELSIQAQKFNDRLFTFN